MAMIHTTQYSFLSSSAIPYDTVTIPITVTSNLVNMIRECRQLLMGLSHLTSLSPPFFHGHM